MSSSVDLLKMLDKMHKLGPKTHIKTRVKNAEKLDDLLFGYKMWNPFMDLGNIVIHQVLTTYDKVVGLPADHEAVKALDSTANKIIDMMIANFHKRTDKEWYLNLIEPTLIAIIANGPKRLKGIKKLRQIRIQYRTKQILRDYLLKKKGKKTAKEHLKPWLEGSFLPQIRIKVLKKGMKLYRGTQSKDDDTTWKYYVYMSDNPFAFRYIKGVQVDYLHEYVLTRDIHVMDFVSHPDLCRPDFKKMLQEHDLYKEYDTGAKSYHTDPEPSSLLQLWLYQKKRIVGHIGMASADCPNVIEGSKLDTKLKANRRLKKGFPEYIFYNYLPILRGLGWLKRVKVHKVKKAPVTNKDDANVEAFYSKFESPKLISPSKVMGKTKKKTTPSPPPKINTPLQAKVTGKTKKKAISLPNVPKITTPLKLSSPRGKELQRLRAKYTKLRERVRKMDPDTAKLQADERSATVGHYAAYWPSQGCTEESGHYVAYPAKGPNFPRCYRFTKTAYGKKALQAAYRRSITKRFYGSKDSKLATMRRLMNNS